jgi:hypothetical protein
MRDEIKERRGRGGGESSATYIDEFLELCFVLLLAHPTLGTGGSFFVSHC